MKYHKAILGGTFDHFHRGHQKLLDAAFIQANEITIGLTTEMFYQHKILATEIETYATREKSIQDYLNEHGYTSQATIMKLTDIYGPALTEKNIEAIFVTEDTISGAQKINAERKKIHFPELDIVLVPFELAEDNQPITSERIRLGEIDEDGMVYALPFISKSQLNLPASLRETLRNPIGDTYTDVKEILSLERSCLITIGDIVTKDFLLLDHQPDLSIIDLKTQRRALNTKEKTLLTSLTTTSFTNEPGSINAEFFQLFSTTINTVLKQKSKHTIQVVGEEDLLTLPVLLLAPLHAFIVYGQQNVGAIAVRSTKEKKEQALSLLKSFN